MAPTGSGDASDVHPAPTAAEVKEEEAPQSLPNAAGDAPDPAAEGDTVGNPQDEVAHMTVPDAEEAGPIARPDGEVAAQPEGDIAAHPQGDIAAEQVAASEEVENVAPMDPAAAAAAQAVQAALAHTAAAAGAQHHAEQVAAEQQVVYSDPSAVPTHFTPPTLPEPVMAPMAPVAAPATDGRGRKSSERYHASMEQLRHLVASFEDNPCPSVTTLNYLSESIGMPLNPLVLWFKNRRARTKGLKQNQRTPGTRRSYVKSGIYSKARRPPAPAMPAVGQAIPVHPALQPHQVVQEHQVVQTEEGQVHADGHVQAVAEVDHGPAPVAMQSPRLPGPPPSSPSQPQAVPDQLPESAEDDAKRAAAVLTGNTPPAKRVRVTEEAKESPVAADCRAWTSVQCLHAFNAFFERSTGGCNPDQGKAAASVAELFFLGEMQSGLTVTSVAQPLDMSLQVLDELLARRAENGEAPLTSGSRSVLGDFIAQIRSGEAAVYAPPDQTAVQPAEAPQGQTEAAETVPAIS